MMEDSLSLASEGCCSYDDEECETVYSKYGPVPVRGMCRNMLDSHGWVNVQGIVGA